MSRESPVGLSRARLSRRQVAKRQDHDRLGVGRVRRRRAPRAAHHRRGDRQGPASATPGPRPTTPCCAGSRSNSMDQLAAFLTSPEVAPGTPDGEPRMALAATRESSPEAAGIFRIFQANADPAPVNDSDMPAATATAPCRCRRAGRPTCRSSRPGSHRPACRKALISASRSPVQKLRDNESDSYCRARRRLVMTCAPQRWRSRKIARDRCRVDEDRGWRARTERSSSSPATRIPRWRRRSPTTSRPR